MPNRNTDTVFQLIKSLEKSEKRNFKLYVTRNSSSEELKIVQLFDALDKMDNYDETILLKKNPEIKKQIINQFPHNAIGDCLYQIKYCSAIYNSIRKISATESGLLDNLK